MQHEHFPADVNQFIATISEDAGTQITLMVPAYSL